MFNNDFIVQFVKSLYNSVSGSKKGGRIGKGRVKRCDLGEVKG